MVGEGSARGSNVEADSVYIYFGMCYKIFSKFPVFEGGLISLFNMGS